jgi:DHA2 family multidrug resistance protein-like MFS transporter
MALSISNRDTAGVITGYALWNVGCSPMVALGVELIVGAVPPEDVGAAGALSETSGQLGYGLGIGVLGSIAAAIYRSRLGTHVVASSLAHSPQVLTAGIDGVIAAVASLLVGIGLLALIALREVPAYARRAEPEPRHATVSAS